METYTDSAAALRRIEETAFDVVVTVGIAGFVLVEAMRSLLRLCIPVSREADRSE